MRPYCSVHKQQVTFDCSNWDIFRIHWGRLLLGREKCYKIKIEKCEEHFCTESPQNHSRGALQNCSQKGHNLKNYLGLMVYLWNKTHKLQSHLVARENCTSFNSEKIYTFIISIMARAKNNCMVRPNRQGSFQRTQKRIKNIILLF